MNGGSFDSERSLRATGPTSSGDLTRTAPPSGADRSAVTAVVGTTLDGVVTFWSDGAERMYHLTRSDVLGRDVHSLLSWPLSATDYANLSSAGEGGVQVLPFRVGARAGSPQVVKFTATVTASPDGGLEVITVAAPALASQPPAALAPSTAHRRTEATQEMTFFLDVSMRVEYVGRQLPLVYGYIPRQVIGNHVFQFLAEEDRPAWNALWRAALDQAGKPQVARMRFRHRDGRWLWAELSLVNQFRDPTVSAMLLHARDITEIHRSEEILAAAEQTLLAVLETSVEGVWIVDGQGRTVFANERLAEILGVTRARLTQASLADLDDVPLAVVVADQNIERSPGAREQLEVPMGEPATGPRWLRVAMSPRFDHVGDFAGSIVMCSDVTEHRLDAAGGPLSRLLSSTAADAARRAPVAKTLDEASVRAVIQQALTAVSPRELDVVTRLVMGDRVPAIADRLFVSQSTVRNQLSSVFRKVGVSSQQDLIELLRDDMHRA